MPITSAKQSLLILPRFIKRGIMMFLDFLLCGFTVWFSFGLRLDQWGLLIGNQWWVVVLAVGLSFPLFIFFGLYRAIFRYVGSAALTSMSRVFILYTGLFFSFFTVVGIDNIPRSIGVIQPILLFIAIGASRYFVRYWLGGVNNFHKTFHLTQPIAMIYGAGSAGRQLVMALSNNKEILVKGFIDDDPHLHGSTINGVAVYPGSDLQDLIFRFDVTDVLLAIPSANQSRRGEIIASLNGCGVRVRTLPGLGDGGCHSGSGLAARLLNFLGFGLVSTRCFGLICL